ncbi:arginase family protein, partial [Streptomyces sp. NPDC005568]|uniref:arginase family protein n=1 Tax=Streptomyces sp. NPDC005568 TaxID=3156887 RepID=UPI0033BF791F
MTAVVPPPSCTTTGLLAVEHLTRVEDGERLHALLWRAGAGWRMIGSSVLGGGIGERSWVLNAQVAHGYRRVDPDRHGTPFRRAVEEGLLHGDKVTQIGLRGTGYAAEDF